MPWKVQKKAGRYAVVDKDTGKVVHRHRNKANATAQVRALYEGEPTAQHPKPGQQKQTKQPEKRRVSVRRRGSTE